VWLQQVGGDGLRLTTGRRECMDVAFSADDTRVLFTAADWRRAKLSTSTCRRSAAHRDW
jgi:hypothetical protein